MGNRWFEMYENRQVLVRLRQVATWFSSPGRSAPPSLVEPFGEQVTAWYGRGVDGTTIHRLLRRRYGFTGSYSSVRRVLEKLEPEPSRATMRLEFSPGEAAQVDFGSGPKLPDPVTGELSSTWVFVITLCWSRHQYAEVVWDQKVATWLGCHQRSFRFFGGVVRRVMIDNAKCAITKACSREWRCSGPTPSWRRRTSSRSTPARLESRRGRDVWRRA